MEWDVPKIVCLVVFLAVMTVIVAALVRGGTGARQAIAEWAADAGLSDVRLYSTSLRPHPQIGTARTGDVTFRITAVRPDGRVPVSGFVKCNTFCRRRNMPATVEAKFTGSSLGPRGFPVRQLGDRDPSADE